MEGFSLYKLVTFYMHKIYIIITLAVLFAIGGYYYETKVKVPMYKGNVSILLVQKQGDAEDNNSFYESVSLNEKLVSTYSEILKSRRILTKVKEDLELEEPIESLRNRVSISTIEDTSMIYITVIDQNNKDAVKIANDLAKVFKYEIKDLYNLENVHIIDEAIREDEPYNIYVVRDTILAGIVGIVIACIILFIYIFIKSKGDFKNITAKKDKKEKAVKKEDKKKNNKE